MVAHSLGHRFGRAVEVSLMSPRFLVTTFLLTLAVMAKVRAKAMMVLKGTTTTTTRIKMMLFR
jgi:hypothetical protein